jgi:asparagine synthetase B (glutamine-hydrolysing)
MEWNNKVGAMHGLEMAFPFLDRDLIAFLMATPGEMHTFRGVPKAILREALRDVLPQAIAGRRSKADFTSVVNDGVSKDYDRLVDCIRGQSLAASMGYVERKVLNDHLAGPESNGGQQTCRVSWALGELLAFELWLQHFSVRTT